MFLMEQVSDKIFKLNEDISKFIYDDPQVNNELNNYAKSFKNGLSRDNLAYFMFEKTLENDQKVIDVYLKNNKDLSAEDKKILKEFKNSINSVFQIKKILKDGFEMYNLVNEKDYTVKSLIKMVNYRGVMTGNYFTCRLISYEKEYYLLVLNSVLKAVDKQQAQKIAVSMQVENPEYLYRDNSKKLKQLEKLVKDLNVKFNDFFKKDEVITTNQNIDELLGAFNDFCEGKDKAENPEDFIKPPEKFEYFKIKSEVDPFNLAENISDKEKYDVGIVFDPELGIQVLPFYGTFRNIFEVKNYKAVNGYKDCILDYFQNGKVSPFVIKKIYDEYGEKFMKIVTEVLELDEKLTFDELLQKYKKDFFELKKFSSTTVLYASEAFSNLMTSSIEMYQEKPSVSVNVGRNDPCPCGSGKKFKKCCIK